MLDRDALLSQVDNRIYTVTVVEEMASTNTALKEMAAEGAPIGTVLIAARQTGGRGRLGRTFHSPEGGVYLSVLMPPIEAATCAAAVAVAKAMGRLCGAQLDIKWVNDLYLNGRKVAGILSEGVFAPDGSLTAVVVGVGINVGRMDFPADLQAIATSLGNESYRLEREEVAVALLNGLDLVWQSLPQNVMDDYRRRNLVLGRQVTVVRGSETYSATAESVTDDGHLIVRTADGEIRELSSGEVSIKL